MTNLNEEAKLWSLTNCNVLYLFLRDVDDILSAVSLSDESSASCKS